MKIKNVFFVPGKSAFFFDDQKAVRKGARLDGFIYEGRPVTRGFTTIRQAGECISIVLEIENGQLAVGDCAAVQYSGVGGRDPLFLADHYLPFMERELKPRLTGMEIEQFRTMARRSCAQHQNSYAHTRHGVDPRIRNKLPEGTWFCGRFH